MRTHLKDGTIEEGVILRSFSNLQHPTGSPCKMLSPLSPPPKLDLGHLWSIFSSTGHLWGLWTFFCTAGWLQAGGEAPRASLVGWRESARAPVVRLRKSSGGPAVRWRSFSKQVRVGWRSAKLRL